MTCVRHGQTQANKEGRFIGVLDQPLMETGRIQARNTATFLCEKNYNFDFLFSSPLIRCIETAEIIQQKFKLKIEIEPALKERNYGVFEGLTSEEAISQYPEIYSEYKKNKPFVPIPQGETAYDVENRILTFLNNRIRTSPTSTHILLVTHLNPIRALLRLLGLVDWEIYFRPFQNASITQIEMESENAKIILFDKVPDMRNACEIKYNLDC